MLTRKQHELLVFIDRHLRQTGFSPSFEEMKEALNLRSKSGIHRLITALEERGFLKRRAHRARALEVVRLPDSLAPGKAPTRAGSGPVAGSNVIRGNFAPNLVGVPSPAEHSTVQLPLYGRIAAGQPIEALRELLGEEWLLQDSLEQSKVGMMFVDHGIEYPQNVTECASVVLFTELALHTDAVSYWSLRLLERVQTLGQELEVLDIAERVPPMNISLVCRDQELMTREAKALADELVYAYTSPHAPKVSD